MAAVIFLDVAGPGALLASALLTLVPASFFAIVLILLEAFALWLLKWDRFPRALLVSFVANLVTTLVGGACLVFFVLWVPWVILAEFAFSVVIEALILMLFKRGAARANWIAALVMNLVSYGLIIAPLYWYGLG